MRFDVVCGNPPYNNDIYLDFVMLGHRLARTYDLWITSIIFVTKSIGSSQHTKDLKVEFNDYYLNKIKSMTYFLDEVDIFEIKKPGGVVSYLAGKDDIDVTHIENKCSRVGGRFDSEMLRPLKNCMFLGLSQTHEFLTILLQTKNFILSII